MASANLETVREHFASFARGDEETHAATYASDCVIEEPGSLPWGGVYRGKEGQQQLVSRYEEAWKQIEVVPQELTESGDSVFALVRLRGRTARGADVDMLTVECFRLRDAKIVEQRVFYWDTAELTRALSG